MDASYGMGKQDRAAHRIYDVSTVSEYLFCTTSAHLICCLKKLIQEAEAAVQPTSELHTSHSQQVSWVDIDTTMMSSTAKLIQKYQPLTW